MLYMAGIKTIDDIQRVTKLDRLAAQTILVRISEYNNKEFTDEERRVCKRFDAFITREHQRQIRNKMRKSWLPIVTGSIITAVILSLIFWLIIGIHSNQNPAINSSSNYNPATSIEGTAPVISSAPAFVTSGQSVEASPSINEEQIVYWLEGSDVYHLDRNCQHIRKYKDSVVRSGTIEQSRKARVCKTCS